MSYPGLACPVQSSPVLSCLIRAGVDRSPVSFRFGSRAAESFDGAKGMDTPERRGIVGCG